MHTKIEIEAVLTEFLPFLNLHHVFLVILKNYLGDLPDFYKRYF